MRKDRNFDQLRDVNFETSVNMHAEGSCLVRFGNTHVLCTASIDEKTPPWLRNSGKGWVTAEYGMLPRSTNTRIDREATRGKQSGRTQEIQRLIGRSLRSVVNLEHLGERQIKIDCDVIQADGGTRTASITGGCVALHDAITYMLNKNLLSESPFKQMVASVSVGIHNGRAVLDLDYDEDSNAETDMNIVMTESGGFIELQGTGEDGDFSRGQLMQMVGLAEAGIKSLISKQQEALAET